VSPEDGAPETPGARAREEKRREAVLARQSAALPHGSAVVSCMAPRGSGGLGRHLAEILLAFERDGRPATAICEPAQGAPRRRPARHALGAPYLITALRALRAPSSLGTRARAAMAEFDAYAAQRLPAAEQLVAFNGQALSQFAAARPRGVESLTLVSANSHLRRLIRQHEIARRRYPLEGSWASRLLARNLAEYERADRVFVASGYIRESFLEEGFDEERLCDFPLSAAPRYAELDREPSCAFEIVYVGSLAVHKGVPLLIDAVRRLAHLDLKLVLVGGWGTTGMRRFVQRACAADTRITVAPGDPVPHLRTASLCVHPAYEDGFAYAPAEALAAGVPVLVSEDTGMKDLIDRGRDGAVVPTGDFDALAGAIEAAYRGELLRGDAR
jgi:glycosyltransferase involved in cell wall biosynthesis